ncbi:uncharacterized protein LOC115985531 [Quercus lobata]|uniref:uncharacterized protein LOC115985531 n=1 Tax=Quercus lobata TaxID=97700 RepID=UPI0012489CA8|nr:uncharacterized protein LOC115985531 [Quercus lobata]
MTKENGKGWKKELPIALWAHRTAKSQATRVSPFSLVYGIEVVILIDLVRLAVKLAEIGGIPREDTMEIMEEMCDNVTSHNRLYQANMKVRKAKLKKESFKWENLFGKLPCMYEELLELLNISFLQNGKDHT